MTNKNKPLSDEDIPFDEDMERYLEEDTEDDKNTILFESEKKPLITPLDQYLGFEPEVYSTYFELEGGLYPDLFGRFEDKTDDVDSRTQHLANTRAGKFYSNLLTAVLNKKLQENKASVGGKTQKQVITQFMDSIKGQLRAASNKDKNKGEKP